MNPAPIDRILANKKEFFLLGVKAAADYSIVKRFNVLVTLVSQETLIYHLFWQLLLIYELVAPLLRQLQSVTTESIFAV
jgi:hypothetical protein